MSRGPWKVKSHHKVAPAAEREREPIGSTIIKIEPWRDTRIAARRKARAKTEALLTSVLYRVASQNRKDAIARKAPRYIGAKCPKHGTPERYSVSGHCIICSRETRRVARHQARQNAGSSIVPPRPVGTWTSVEQPDTVNTGYRTCSVGGRPIPDIRINSVTCSATCRRAAYRHSNLVNHSAEEKNA